MKRYVERPKTAYEHAWEIRVAYGFRVFEDEQVAAEFRRFLDGREWTHPEGPAALFALREHGDPVDAAAVARLSPLGHAHLNCLGRYSFPPPHSAGLRPLRDPDPAANERAYGG